MMYPPIGELMKRTDSRYSLVIAVAKRARELSQGAEVLVKCDSKKEVTEAVYELYHDKVKVIKASENAEESETEVSEQAVEEATEE
ncbi:MAG: DNA-directed RNA polymerase subunit omega [Ruminococcaceae bacterium]|nr:DNA-directed RNA polymerase subunit omega [Oscillospiraceae bacterium]